MQKIRCGVVVLSMLLCWSATPVPAQVSISIGLPNVSIGINLPLFPELVPVPGYPVYYAPRVNANYFFYDGLYWVYLDDYWYASNWYNGPWWIVEPNVVPVFILRVPVRYYRSPPVYFRGWRPDAPPRWGTHWGPQWEQQRRGWDKWKRSTDPVRAPLPVYQRQYTGDRYPRQVEQQQTLHHQQYRYQPRDTAVRPYYQQQGGQGPAPAPATRGRQEEPRTRGPGPQETQRQAPVQQSVPHAQPPQQIPPQRVPPVQQQRAPAVQEHRQQPGAIQPEQRAPWPQGQEQRPQRVPPGQEQKQQRAPAVQEQRPQQVPAVQEHRQQPRAVQPEQQAPRPQGQEQRMQERQQEHGQGQGQGHGQRKEEDRGR